MNTILRFILFFLPAPAFAIVAQADGVVQDDFRIVDEGGTGQTVRPERVKPRVKL